MDKTEHQLAVVVIINVVVVASILDAFARFDLSFHAAFLMGYVCATLFVAAVWKITSRRKLGRQNDTLKSRRLHNG